MIRRRRPKKGIHFSFDSFLDVVANVVGIIIRLILVAWVGAKSYKGLEIPDIFSQPAVQQAEADYQNLVSHINEKEKEVKDWEAKLTHLKNEGTSSEKFTYSEIARLDKEFQKLSLKENFLKEELKKVEAKEQVQQQKLAQVKEKLVKLEADFLAVNKSKGPVQVLQYQTPVSKTLQSEELLFECRNGKVTPIDIGSMLEDIGGKMQDIGERLRTQWEWVETTKPYGAFRMCYTVERIKTGLELAAPNAPPDSRSNFRYALTGWELIPVDPDRGETLDQALKPASDFSRIINGLDSGTTAISFCVYPDSFSLYRRLRDITHESKFVVAGRPLMFDAPIAMSVRKGTASRGQ